MPWKGVKDPYKIWLSEIILQQTRVAQGLPYYEKFIENFPTIFDLAKADDQYIFKLWEGLGYYNRCRNLLYTARYIVDNYNGIFPNEYNDIIDLKGIGPYTAAAIASFAFNQSYAVIDGNVFRVLSRYFGVETATDSKEGLTIFSELAEKMLDKKLPGIYNQVIMDFGATICQPALPLCKTCILSNECVAYTLGKVNKLPIKEKTLTKKSRYFTWFVFLYKKEVYIQQRTQKDIWQNLYEFYLVESENKPNWNESIINQWLTNQFDISSNNIYIQNVAPQQLTHQKIMAQFVVLDLNRKPKHLENGWIKRNDLKNFGFPKLCKEFIEQHLLDKSF